MSTLSSSLNSSAAALVNDIVLPLRGLPPEHPSGLRLAKGATLLFGGLQIAVGASGLGGNEAVVNQVLGIAALTTGLLLGIYLLGTATSHVRQGHAVFGLCCGLAVDLVLKFGLPGVFAASTLAWPWYSVVGSVTTFAGGLVAAAVRPARAAV
jgi:Na+/proline symporter